MVRERNPERGHYGWPPTCRPPEHLKRVTSPSQPDAGSTTTSLTVFEGNCGSEWLSPPARAVAGPAYSRPPSRTPPTCPAAGPAPSATPQRLLPARVREGMVPSERARLRRPGSEEGEARRGDRNSCWLARGRKPGGVGMNRDGEEPATLEQGMARLGQVGKRLAESPGKYL